MRRRLLFSTLLIFALSCLASAANPTPGELARAAVDADRTISGKALAELRKLGPRGLDALFEEHSAAIADARAGNPPNGWARITDAIDAVAMQKDAASSQLYWYTDFDEAVRAATASGKPILSLRLLGNLNEEFSCANSRFFRALLYANREISAELRENYVLHWQSVRPAPRLTIDFGDGRRIERTITGNSIHYLLTPEGFIIDALPGLYRPTSFLKTLRDVSRVSGGTTGLSLEKRLNRVRQYRDGTFKSLADTRSTIISRAKIKLIEPAESDAAIDVMPRAVTKMMVEAPYLTDDFARFESQLGLDEWRRAASFYAAETQIDESSRRIIARQSGLAPAALEKLLAKLHGHLSIDTTRNDFLFRPKILGWLSLSMPPGPEAINTRVYRELFRTPDDDPWLGLYDTGIYTALDGNGITR